MRFISQATYALIVALLPLCVGCQTESNSATNNESDATVETGQSEAAAGGATVAEATPSSDQAILGNAAEWTTLKGRFVLDGTAPDAKALTINRDKELCTQFNLKSEDLVVDENGGIADVFIWVTTSDVEIHPDLAEASGTVRLTNKDCRYAPHGMVMRAGQTLELGNDDPVSHNVNLPFRANNAFNQIVPPGESVTLSNLAKAERLPVKAECNIHPWMSGHILIQEHPYAAVSGADGSFEIANLPAGDKLKFRVWHAAAGYLKEVSIDGKKQKWRRGQFEEKLEGAEVDLGDIEVKLKLFKL
ncbi:MAG: hypothetical protein DWQ31_07395 [Planctomycetota bacterium]|nr:MAG: hypothetical protein DWQ31_07395 [Planctomycetota bacterium]REJ96234.1 MAG: hypothetical protein DWQ35_04865 [Planctomycetota bacterium]